MNIIEYAEKNGKYSFSDREFCEVDSLVISQLSYLKFDGILPGPANKSEGIKLSDLLKHKKYELLYRDERYADINSKFFLALAGSKRFGSLILNDFIDVIDDNLDIQFSAMTVSDKQGFTYVVFRGTDDSIVGWKEDLNMTFKIPVPAQKYSVDYLNKVAQNIDGKFYVGGHSKGGNLSVYSSMNCEEEVRERIISIYSHDGPGFRKELLDNSCYDKIKERIIKFVPKSAVVGMFGNAEEFEVVDCEKHGVKQHNPYNWIINDFEFERADHIGRYSMLQADAINSWASEMTKEKWALLSDQIFGVFESAGITNLNDFNDDFWGSLSRIRLAVDQMDDESRDKIREILSMFRETATQVAKDDAKENMHHAEEGLKQAKQATKEKVHNVNDKVKSRIKK